MRVKVKDGIAAGRKLFSSYLERLAPIYLHGMLGASEFEEREASSSCEEDSRNTLPHMEGAKEFPTLWPQRPLVCNDIPAVLKTRTRLHPHKRAKLGAWRRRAGGTALAGP